MKDFLVNIIVGKALPIIAASLATFVMAGMKRVWQWIDRQSALVQRSIVVALGIALSFVATWAGVQLPVECANLADGVTENCWAAVSDSQKVVSGVIGAVLAFAWHSARKGK